jgi:hypothetical protein
VIYRKSNDPPPPWHYWLVRRDLASDTDVYATMPIALLLRAVWRLWHWWNRARSKSSWIDELVSRAYDRGFSDGMHDDPRNK